MSFVKVYTADWCANCSSLKKKLEGDGIAFSEIDVDSPEGMKEAKELGIRSLPYVHAENQYGSEMKGVGMIMAQGLKEFLEGDGFAVDPEWVS